MKGVEIDATLGGGAGSSSAGSGGSGGSGGNAAAEKCSPGDIEPCWESADGVKFEGDAPQGQATCHAGERKCQGDTTWGACLGAVGPEMSDTCDPGNDANCNGTPNEGCSCTDGMTRACGSDMGNCKQGTQTCKGMAWGPCEGEVVKAANDTCDADDDANCNGKPNEGCDCVNGETKSCGTDVGPCEFGMKTCVNGVYPDACEGGVPAAEKDTCEPGNDASCNGAANEGCECNGTASQECGIKKGACQLGMQTCTDGKLSVCSVQPTANDTCLAADDANDTNCNGIYRDGCECVATDAPKVCPDANGCGTETCDGATGKWSDCVGDIKLVRCNPSAPDNRQVCSAGGVWTNDLCPSGSACRANGTCKTLDGKACTANGDCDSNVCTSFYVDADKDGYALNATVVKLCGATVTGYVATASNKGTDCNDGAIAINPGATEACDGIDNDCDNKIDLADGLAVSGTTTEVGTAANTRSQIDIAWAAEKSLYGIAYEDDTAATKGIYFTAMSQAGAVQTAAVNAGTTSDGYALHLIWGTDNFGLTWFNSNGNVEFRTVASNGALGVVRHIINGAMAKPQVGRIGTGNWGVSYIDYGTGFGLVGAKTVTAAGVIGTHHDVTTTNSNFSYLVGTGSTFATVTELADSSAQAKVFDNTFGAPGDVVVAGSTPIMGRGPNGFAIAVQKGAGKQPQFYSYDDGGNASCGPVNFGDTSFAPTDAIGTADGYLVVASGTTIRAQLIKPDCTLGPLFTVDAAAGTYARVSGGTAGYGVVWEATANKVKRRFFGPKFCN
ncbi:MAG TPA: putative metal-binding motif-containing protein [Polyangiaceae bacterium]|nr:putative metal-binding motif-containing protein [Polyangiaceae bacterium]